jgi:hypothetical protein
VELISQNPAFAENVMRLIMLKYDPTEDQECIFEKKKMRKELYELAHEAKEMKAEAEGGEVKLEEDTRPAVDPMIARTAIKDIETKKRTSASK